ncbi:MAG: glycosyltransferase family 1 protein [Chloroflexi bacterium]|nr:glycosyltransferase family 1 protein [Chloroflexota bacterium]
MNICLDLSAAVHQRAGIGRYTRELTVALTALAPEHTYTAFFNRAAEARPDPAVAALPRLPVPWGDKPWRLRVMLAHLLRRPQDALLPGVDLFHGADHLLPYLERIPGVFTLYDLTYLTAQQAHTTLNRLYLTLMAPRFLRAARAVIVISESTRRDALSRYPGDAGKFRVIYGGVSRQFCPAAPHAAAAVRQRYGLPERFILAVGTIEPRKNYEALLAAYRALRDRGQTVGLVIAGKKGWRSEAFFRQLHDLGLEDRVRLLGYVADADLPALYTAAEVFAFPSLYEGFGLPALEAMACGTPVVASNTSSLPEVVGDAGLLVSPRDVAGLTTAIEAALTDAALRADLCARGLTQAGRFTWEATARATLQVYQVVLGSGAVG